jgi:DNA polymerase (family 10)
MRVLDPKCWPFALLHFTGSKANNIAMRKAASERGMRLNEYGLFILNEDGEVVGEYKKVVGEDSCDLDCEYD